VIRSCDRERREADQTGDFAEGKCVLAHDRDQRSKVFRRGFELMVAYGDDDGD
jgi:hypothetical protein